MDVATQERVQAWSLPPFDEQTIKAVIEMGKKEPEALTNAFYTRLSFGTGGVRGLMGIGTNRLNTYTVAFTTEGLARYLRKTFGAGDLSVFVGYDCRHHSKDFAEVVACILAGHGIKAYLTDTIVTTPFTSFSTRFLKCQAGVMITASHNPKEYNGYKVYWQDGSQILSPHDKGIEKEYFQITSPDQVKKAAITSPLIERVGNPLKEEYDKALLKLKLLKNADGSSIKIVYTNLHGTGIVFVPELMNKWGFTHFETVKEQETPDGNFPTVDFPNPEEPASLELGLQTLGKVGGDILIATDPDGDRMRIAVRHQGNLELLNGNQIACLLLHHILTYLPQKPANSVVIKTIVTTDLFRKIASAFNVECVDVLTGFKYIGELIHQYEDGSKTYLFGGEESYGTLFGTSVRDKDGVMASLLIAEACLAAHLQGKTLVDKLNDLYATFGHYAEGIRSITYPETKEGHEEMRRVMDLLRSHPPTSIHRLQVIATEDYLKKKKIDLKTGAEELLTLPISDVLIFRLENDAKLIIRPSGTEPKIKIYGEVIGEQKECQALLEACHNLLHKLTHE